MTVFVLNSIILNGDNMINTFVKKLVCYGKEKGLFGPLDEIFVTNRILELLRLESFDCQEEFSNVDLEETLKGVLDYAVQNGIIEDTITKRDLFDTAIMGAMMPPPSTVIEKFNNDYKISPQKATDNYYKLSCDSDYIRRYRIKKDLRWVTATPYGDFDITVNLSKPEKDPKAIAAARTQKPTDSSVYPKCLLCKECEGYSGRINFPARQNLRIIPIELDGDKYCMQYSPYVYYNEHCIVFNAEHTPMVINKNTFAHLLSFVEKFPHYFIGSNADLPIVGGSILTHDHFQGGNYTFAMARAEITTKLKFKGFEDVKAGIVNWPISVIRLNCNDKDRVLELADKILTAWRGYTDEEAFIFAETDGALHNTITPIARRRGESFELDLALRNNITTEEHPAGVYHPHAELHHIKRENIGLIEVMGLAVLPSRLKKEIGALKTAILENKSIEGNEELAKHADWFYEIKAKYSNINADNIDKIFEDETGTVFYKALEHSGVYKQTKEGKAGFLRFVDFVNSK